MNVAQNQGLAGLGLPLVVWAQEEQLFVENGIWRAFQHINAAATDFRWRLDRQGPFHESRAFPGADFFQAESEIKYAKCQLCCFSARIVGAVVAQLEMPGVVVVPIEPYVPLF